MCLELGSIESFNQTVRGNCYPAALRRRPTHEVKFVMKIILAGPPKTGNVWVESILAIIYKLEILIPPKVPKETAQSLREFIEAGHFKDNAIFHQHFAPTEEFFEAAALAPCHLVTILRNPYDVFVSLYHYIQNFSQGFIRASGAGKSIIGLPIDDPRVLSFLKENFRTQLVLALDWLKCGRSLLLRYEDLHQDAFGQIKRLTDQIQPVEDQVIAAGIEASDAQKLRAKSPEHRKHIRSAKVGDWKNHLKDEHLKIIRDEYADLITALGYEVI
jgi:hypothetical protein